MDIEGYLMAIIIIMIIIIIIASQTKTISFRNESSNQFKRLQNTTICVYTISSSISTQMIFPNQTALISNGALIKRRNESSDWIIIDFGLFDTFRSADHGDERWIQPAGWIQWLAFIETAITSPVFDIMNIRYVFVASEANSASIYKLPFGQCKRVHVTSCRDWVVFEE